MAELWESSSQFSGKHYAVLKWTGYQSNLTGKAVERAEDMQHGKSYSPANRHSKIMHISLMK